MSQYGQYGQTVGLANDAGFVKSFLGLPLSTVTFIMLIVVLTFLLLLSGDVELNPGPPPPKLSKLTICHSNIRGLNESKLRAIKTSLCQFDIITLSETFLGPSSIQDLNLPGYHPIIRRDRDSFGGGVAVYIRENIMYKRLVEYEFDNQLETLWLHLNTLEGKVLLSTVYRPPHSNEFWDRIDGNIDYVKSVSSTQYMMIIGDMNADFRTANGRKLADLCNLHNLMYHITEPTRITTTSRTCLDQILTNFPNFVCETNVDMPVSNNDHCTVSIKLNFKHQKQYPYHRLVWLYKDGDYEGYRTSLSSANWEECFESDDMDNACKMWTEKVLNTARTFIPNRLVLIRPRDKPWYTNELRSMKRKVHRIYNKAKRTDTVANWERYKLIQQEYKKALDDAELTHKRNLNEKLCENRNSKPWWTLVKDIIGKGGSETYPPVTDPVSKTPVYDDGKKTGVFNSFFLSLTAIDLSNAKLPDNSITDSDLFLETIEVTESEILELLNNINPNKASGPDGISPRILKEAGPAIVPSLTKLIKMSLQQCKVPKLWKKANVIPIHKKESKEELNNYRPISLLPVASKILEKVIFKNVYNYLHENELLSKHQSGFRPKDSTVNQLSFMYHEFCKALDMKKDVRLVFCDVSKAFDKVWYQGLLYKLRKNGIKGNLLHWFQDYLTDRKQRVIIRGESSSWGSIMAGVPQGSVLGPLLFLIYINDIVDVVNCNLKLYADDTCLYVTTDDPVSSATCLNNNLDNVLSWSRQWLVNFNPNKTKSMIISNKKSNHPPLYFDGQPIEEVDNHKHLGIILNNKLNWKDHVSNIVKSVSKLLDVMHKLHKDLDRKSLETIYQSFVRPKLEYACIIWDDCFDQDTESLEKCQLRAARIVTGAKRGTSHEKLYEETKWTKLKVRREQYKLCFTYKVVNNVTPEYLVEILPNVVNKQYLLRNNNIEQYRCRTEKYYRSLFPDIIRKWNNLDEILKAQPSYSVFKNLITAHEKCSKLYYIGSRKVNIIHAQLRMNCSNLNAHLYGLHVIDSPACLCSHSIEDNVHFFFDCPLYSNQRLVLRQTVAQFTDFNLETLLFGDDDLEFQDKVTIILAVHEFIKDSDRFSI